MPRESKRARRERAALIVEQLKLAYPDSACSLTHRSAFELLVATVLSAQCTDARVNQTTPALFSRYPGAAALAAAEVDAVEATIRSVNYYRTKSRALIGLAAELDQRYGGEVPRELEELTTLPGVGRKTANVVRGVWFGDADGVVVDTHVLRVTKRLGLTSATEPVAVEQDLLALLPPEERVAFTHRVIDHGRAICVARRPRCEICPLLPYCPTGQRGGVPGRAAARPRSITNS